MTRKRYYLKTTERGLGSEHQKERARLLPLAYGQPCPLCGWVMLPGQALDLDHPIPRMIGGKSGNGRIVHAHCNRAQGSRIRAAVLKQRWRSWQQIEIRSRNW